VCHIMFQNSSEITCLVLKQGSEPDSMSILWHHGYKEDLFAKIVCKCTQSCPSFMFLRLLKFFHSLADPAVSSIQAQCHQGKFSGWIVFRGSLGFGSFPLIGNAHGPSKFPFQRIRVAVTAISSDHEISAKHVFALNYSSSDFAAFVHNSHNDSQFASVSLSSDGFTHQSLLIGSIGKNFFGIFQIADFLSCNVNFFRKPRLFRILCQSASSSSVGNPDYNERG
jgi:hypothetical protein